MRLAAPGTLQLDFAWAALNRPDQRWWHERWTGALPLPLVLTGQGGEIARRWYDIGSPRGPAEAVRRLIAASRSIWPRPVLSRQGKQLLHAYVDDLGADTRMPVPRWRSYPSSSISSNAGELGGGPHALDEYMTDLASPLLSRRLLPYELGLPAGDRARELFHFHVLEALSPELTRMRSPDPPGLATFGRNPPERARKLRTATVRVRRELSSISAHGSPLAGKARGENACRCGTSALERALGQPTSDDIWRILDRRRTFGSSVAIHGNSMSAAAETRGGS